MAVTKESIYNEALRFLGERGLASGETRGIRYKLDDCWTFNYPDTWLEQADWLFASRSVKIQSDPDFSKEWGFSYAYNHPVDMVRPSGIYIDEQMKMPLTEYLEEEERWYADVSDAIYVRYVSNDLSFGGDLGKWPRSFARYVSAFLAYSTAPEHLNSKDRIALYQQVQALEKDARSKNGLRRPAKSLPKGSWVNARIRGNGPDDYGKIP